ncbi:MAG: hypothetical protein GC154_15410 [bacterium]|nr:hypothetical protein [bacterium]
MMKDIKKQLEELDTGRSGERVDYHEADLGFRHRLESLVPNDLADRVRKVLAERLKQQMDDPEEPEAVNL